MKPAICVSELRKSYGTNQVLKGVSFDILPGEIFGILGVNGAGKTTMLECIEGFRRYESGRIQVEGKTGVQLQSASLPAIYGLWRRSICLKSGKRQKQIHRYWRRWRLAG